MSNKTFISKAYHHYLNLKVGIMCFLSVEAFFPNWVLQIYHVLSNLKEGGLSISIFFFFFTTKTIVIAKYYPIGGSILTGLTSYSVEMKI